MYKLTGAAQRNLNEPLRSHVGAMKGFSYCGYSFLPKIGGGKLTLS